MKSYHVILFAALVGVGVYALVNKDDRDTDQDIAPTIRESVATKKAEAISSDTPNSLSEADLPTTTIDTLASTRPPRIVIDGEGTERLFVDLSDSEIDSTAVDAFLSNRRILSYRIVSVDGDLLRTRIRHFPESGKFGIQLLNSAPTELVTTTAAEHSEGWQTGYGTWIGRVAGDETSSATLFVAPDGSVNGQVRTAREGRTRIENVPGTIAHVIWRREPGSAKKID